MNIIPIPASITLNEEDIYVFLNSDIKISLSKFSQKAVKVFLKRTGLHAVYDDCQNIDISMIFQANYSKDEYELSVTTEGITVKASSDTAVIHAMATLLQLMDKKGNIPCCQIHDEPKYGHRGLSLDCVRHFFPVEEVKRIIEQMSLVKMNVLHWRLTDDQGWRIESKRFPKLHQQHGEDYFTHDDIREVISYAEIRGIEVIPEIDMPGHVTALLAAYPQYSCSGKSVTLATYGGIHPIILCAGNESTYEMISDLLDEVCPLFPSNRFHIGGDEAPKDEWENCSCCQQKIQQEGLVNEAALQGYFSNRVIEMLRKKGKTAICWNESLDSDNFESQSLVQFWTVNGAEKLNEFVQDGGKFINSDMFAYYLDYPHCMTSLHRLYEEPLCIGDMDYTNHPAMLGVEVCMWTEHTPDAKSLEEKIFPRLYAAAEVMWSNSESRSYEDFEKRLVSFLKAHHPADIALVPISGWNPTGEEKMKGTLAYMDAINNAMPPEHRAETAKRSAPTELFQRKFRSCFFGS